MKPTATLLLVSVFVLGTASSQEDDLDTASRDGERPPAPDQLEQCFNAEGFTDFDVMSDRNVYVRTRGGNHYLVSTEHCENLARSHLRGTVRLVPYGRRVCQGDGSHIVYDANGRERPCRILKIERVQDRAEALALSEQTAPLIRIEEAPPPD